MELTPLQEAIIKKAGKTVEEFLNDVQTAPSPLQPVKQEVKEIDTRTMGMQTIDQFTLSKTSTLEEKTVGMQNIDKFTLDTIASLQLKIAELEQRIQTLEGGN